MVEHTPVVEQPLVDGQSATPWSEGRQRLETPERKRILWVPESRSWVLSCEFARQSPGRDDR
jgi:hypothetical protein